MKYFSFKNLLISFGTYLCARLYFKGFEWFNEYDFLCFMIFIGISYIPIKYRSDMKNDEKQQYLIDYGDVE